jgi:hypothetical protein
VSEDTEEARQAAAFRKLINHPEIGMDIKRKYKQITPDARFPDLEIEDRLAENNKTWQARLDAQEAELREDRIERQRAKNHKFVRDEGFEPDAIEKVMTEEKIASYETAVKFVRAQNAATSPTPGSYTPIRMPEATSDLRKHPIKWAQDTAHKALDELRARRQA